MAIDRERHSGKPAGPRKPGSTIVPGTVRQKGRALRWRDRINATPTGREIDWSAVRNPYVRGL